MKARIIGLCILGASFGLSSCNDFLDMTPTDSISDKMLWSTATNAEYAVNELYKYFYNLSNFALEECAAGMTEALTDELKYGSYNYNALCFIPSEIAYGGTTLQPSYVSTYLGNWENLYEYVRRTNENLSNLHKYGTFSSADAERFEAEMRFIRAFLYFDLLKRYKEVIIYNEDMTQIVRDKALSSEEAGWDFVEEDLNYAATHLPDQANAKGRIDKGAAYAFLTRAMLYAKRYDKVKSAAEEVQKLGYTLESNYADSYSKTILNGNKEAILQYCFDRTIGHDFDTYYTPGGDYKLIGVNSGGYGTPTQEMVESYELAKGGFPDWSTWHNTEGVTDTPPYGKLEPRFQATILYNGAMWKGRTIETFVDGLDGWCQWNKDKTPEGRSTTGYYLRKLVDENHNLADIDVSIQPWTVIRYAEVLLNYAEACYQTGDNAGANEAIRTVRSRVGLPYSDKSGDKLWKAIVQERKIELAYEGQWYWDLRRWNVAAKSYEEGGLNGYQVHGLKIEKQANGDLKYTYVSCDDKDRNFPEKMYRLPLPQSELDNNSAVTQYPEWK